MCKTILCSKHARTVKNQKSTDKHSSFHGLIHEDIYLSDIYLAVLHIFIFKWKFNCNRINILVPLYICLAWAFSDQTRTNLLFYYVAYTNWINSPSKCELLFFFFNCQIPSRSSSNRLHVPPEKMLEKIGAIEVTRTSPHWWLLSIFCPMINSGQF